MVWNWGKVGGAQGAENDRGAFVKVSSTSKGDLRSRSFTSSDYYSEVLSA